MRKEANAPSSRSEKDVTKRRNGSDGGFDQDEANSSGNGAKTTTTAGKSNDTRSGLSHSSEVGDACTQDADKLEQTFKGLSTAGGGQMRTDDSETYSDSLENENHATQHDQQGHVHRKDNGKQDASKKGVPGIADDEEKTCVGINTSVRTSADSSAVSLSSKDYTKSVEECSKRDKMSDEEETSQARAAADASRQTAASRQRESKPARGGGVYVPPSRRKPQ